MGRADLENRICLNSPRFLSCCLCLKDVLLWNLAETAILSQDCQEEQSIQIPGGQAVEGECVQAWDPESTEAWSSRCHLQLGGLGKLLTLSVLFFPGGHSRAATPSCVLLVRTQMLVCAKDLVYSGCSISGGGLGQWVRTRAWCQAGCVWLSILALSSSVAQGKVPGASISCCVKCGSMK